MSDDDDDYGVGVADPIAVAARRREVFEAICNAGDPPHVEMASFDFVLFREGEPKAVVLVASKFHLYLFKRRNWKLYRTWDFDECVVSAETDEDGEPVLAIRDTSPDAPLEPDEFGTDWASLLLMTRNDRAQLEVSERVNDIMDAAIAATEKADPLEHLMNTAEGAGKPSFDGEFDADGTDDDASSETSSTADAAAGAKGTTAAQRSRARAATKEELARQEADRNAASARSIICGPLTDGDLTDFSALTDAYANGESASMLAELKAFVADSDKAIELVCQEHYLAFLEAADRGAAVDTSKVGTLGEDLARNAAAVKVSGDAIATAGRSLMAAERTHGNIVQAEAQLRQALALAKMLERSEHLVAKGVLEGAVSALGMLGEAAQRTRHTKLGRYIADRRLGELRTATLRQAVREMNAWLTHVRDAAPQLGANIASAFAEVAPGAVVDASGKRPTAAVALPETTRSIVSLPNGDWVVKQSRPRMSADAVAAAFRLRYDGLATAEKSSAAADAAKGSSGGAAVNAVGKPSTSAASPNHTMKFGGLTGRASAFAAHFADAAMSDATKAEFAVCDGATLQTVFAAAGEAAIFRACLQQSRAKQLDLLRAQSGSVFSAGAFAAYSEQCVGFVAVENLLCYSATLPRLRAPLDVTTAWEALCGSMLRALGQVPLLPDRPPEDPTQMLDTARALALARQLNAVANGVEAQVQSVRLSTALLREAAKELRDRVHSQMLGGLSARLSDAVMADPLVPLVVSSQAEFADAVTAFHLHAAQHLIAVDSRFRGVEAPPSSTRRSGASPAANAGPTAAPSSGSQHRLPFTRCVPAAGQLLYAFVTEAFDVSDACAADGSADERILKYLLVAGRTLASTLNARLQTGDGMLHAALVGANASALTVILSAVEQRLVVRWRGAVPAAPQRLGHPTLLQPVAQDLKGTSSKAFDSVALALVRQIDKLWEIGTVAKYWYKRAALFGKKSGGLSRTGASPRNGAGDHDAADNESIATATTEATAALEALSDKACCSVKAVAYVRESKTQLEAIWQPDLVHSLAAAAVMHLAEVAPQSIATAIRRTENREIPKLRAAVDQFESEAIEPVLALAAEAGVRFPMNLRQACDELRKEIEAREVEYAAEQAKKLAIQANLEALGGAVGDGFRAVGDGVVSGAKATADGVKTVGKATRDGVKATADGVKTVGKATADGVKTVGTTARRGIFFWRRSSTNAAADAGADSQNGFSLPASQNPSPATTPRSSADPTGSRQ